MKNILLILFALLVWNDLIGQDFKLLRKGVYEISEGDLNTASVNGLVSINDLGFPDKEFSEIRKLGEPISIEEIHNQVEDSYTYHYPGLMLIFNNSEGEIRLAYLELNDSESFLTFDKGYKVMLDSEFTDKLLKLNSKSETGETQDLGDILIKFPNYESSKMILKKGVNGIEKIRLWL